MSSALRVLACGVQETEARLRAVLPDGELHLVFNTANALNVLRGGAFDLVLIGMVFDESRALELMRRIMADPTLHKAPIVGIRGARTGYRVLPPAVFDMPMRAMGAADVIDFRDIPNDEAGNASIRQRLHRACGR